MTEYNNSLTVVGDLLTDAYERMGEKRASLSMVNPAKLLDILLLKIPNDMIALDIDKCGITDMYKCYNEDKLAYNTLVYANRIISILDEKYPAENQ